jgi:manganese-dependent inorganic pyrophosphatase
MQNHILVFGHANPDTDAVTSAMVYASFLNATGTPATAYRIGSTLNPETLYVLTHGPSPIALPAVISIADIKPHSKVALVDHNESSQSIEVLHSPELKLQITAVIDHHKIGDLQTSEPIYCRIEPVGCTGTILYSLYKENDVSIPPVEAHLMMSAILSDTLNLVSPTTTSKDKRAVEVLAPICQCKDTSAYALEMFKAKSDVSHISAVDLVKLDYKVFDTVHGSYGIGGVETVDVPSILARAKELSIALDTVKANSPKPLAGIFLVVVDVLATKSTAILPATAGIEQQVIAKAYSTAITMSSDGVALANLGSNVSRKKQLVPLLLASLSS